MDNKDKFDRFGFKIIGVSDDEVKILREKGINISVTGHGNAYFDYLSERNKAMDILGRCRKLV